MTYDEAMKILDYLNENVTRWYNKDKYKTWEKVIKLYEKTKAKKEGDKK